MVTTLSFQKSQTEEFPEAMSISTQNNQRKNSATRPTSIGPASKQCSPGKPPRMRRRSQIARLPE